MSCRKDERFSKGYFGEMKKGDTYMYCSKCGKKINEGMICAECFAREASSYKSETIEIPETHYQDNSIRTAYTTTVRETVPTKSRMEGFGKALTSTILSFFGFIFSYVSLILILAEVDIAISVVFLLFSLPLTIIPFVQGVNSIRLFKETTAPDPKPIPTLILGINGVFWAGLSLFFVSLCFMMFTVMG